MNAKTNLTDAERELAEFSLEAKSSNAIYDEDAEMVKVKATSVLYLLKEYILKEESPGIAEEHAQAAGMILQCAIYALDLQSEFQERKARVEGGGA